MTTPSKSAERPPFSKGYKHRDGNPVSDACGEGRHGECTQDLTKCGCTFRGLHKTMHAYMSSMEAAPAKPAPKCAGRRESAESELNKADAWAGIDKIPTERYEAPSLSDERPAVLSPAELQQRVEILSDCLLRVVKILLGHGGKENEGLAELVTRLGGQ